jgi:hypothetical protein
MSENKINKYVLNPLSDRSQDRKVMIETICFSGLLGLIFIFAGVYYSKSGQDSVLKTFLAEDGWVEWLQFLFFFATSMFALLAHYIFRKKNNLKWISFASLGMFSVFAVFLFGAMEEISYAQRLIGRESSEFFLQNNRQGETNLHNMEIGGVGVNKLIFGKILFLAILIHNILLPIIAERKKSISDWATVKMGGFFPPLLLVGFYLIAAIAVESIASGKRKELIEMMGALHYFTAVFLTYGLGFKVKDSIFKGESLLYASRAFMGFCILMVMLAWMLSVTVRTAW